MSNAGRSIRQAITLDHALPELALDAANSGQPFIGFYFEYFGDEGQEGEWSYWGSETAENTATNVYYTPSEILELLTRAGFKATATQA